MCGFVGILIRDKSQINNINQICPMLDSIKHRGPDDFGITCFSTKTNSIKDIQDKANVDDGEEYDGVVGFNRLSILDLSKNGHQPMIDHEEKIILLFNGEVYNAFDFRNEIISNGIKLKSKTDTEILLSLYKLYGFEKMLEKIEGMFSIVIIDLKKNIRFMARDRFGIKPLYYYLTKDVLLFSSEVKSFLHSDYFKSELNNSNINEYMIFNQVCGEETLLKNVFTVLPGEFILIRDDKLVRKTYWDTNLDSAINIPTNEKNILNELETLLSSSVYSQLMSDVQIGFQLSGGIDSSLILNQGLSSGKIYQSVINSISILFQNEKYSEEAWINEVVNANSHTNHKIYMDSDFILKNISRASWHNDFPISIPNSLSILLLAENAKKYFTVCLSGEGADELFCGYHRFFYGALINNYYPAFIFPHFLKGILDSMSLKWFNELIDVRKMDKNSFMDTYIIWNSANLSVLDFLNTQRNFGNIHDKRLEILRKCSGDFIHKFQQYEIKTNLVSLLERQDKMTMANSIENRVPFLHSKIYELTKNIPSDMLVNIQPGLNFNSRFRAKHLLKKLSLKNFDKSFVYRSKMGFHTPIEEYFQSPKFIEFINDSLLPSIKNRGLFDYSKVENLIDNFKTLNQTEWVIVWRVLVFEIWAQQFLD